ncbi:MULTISPECIES: ABC transporter permease [unclassified Nocardia]|uniref:ABC transporter permease n=1 Tax=unclassified Nocardia TaxID=2637762 RepID=UPI001CE4407A|nr:MULTISPECIES: ABC transporter permease [unclassified Nocardia]
MGRTAAAFADSYVMFLRSVRHTLRSPDTLLISLTLPVLIMLLFVYVFGGAIQVGGPYIDFVIPGIILLCTGFGASITATAVATDLRTGAVDRFRTLPSFRQALLVGHVGEGVLRNLAAVGIVLVLGVILGFRSGAGVFGWLGAVVTIALFVIAITWIAVALGLLARSPEAAGGFTYAIMFIPYVSGAFVPTGSMPSWLRGFAEHQPATPVVGTIRGLLMGDAVGGTAWVAVLWCVGLTVAGYTCAARLFRRLTD